MMFVLGMLVGATVGAITMALLAVCEVSDYEDPKDNKLSDWCFSYNPKILARIEM